MYIPSENITKNKDDIITYINNKYQSKNANDFVNQVKFLFDTHQFIKVAKNINDQIYINQLTNITEDNAKKGSRGTHCLRLPLFHSGSEILCGSPFPEPAAFCRSAGYRCPVGG